jgi:hypothetical protein
MFVVFEPGITGAVGALGSVPKLRIELALAPGQPQLLDLEVSDEAIGQVIDTAFRVGGWELLRELVEAIDVAKDPPGATGLVRHASELCAAPVAQLRQDAYAGLIAVDAAARLALDEALTEARGALHLSHFGLIEGSNQARPPVSKVAGAPETYHALRNTVIALDKKYRNLRRWNFTIPANAPTARRQFEDNAYLPYVEALRAAAQRWPALQTTAPTILRKLFDERRSDMTRWSAELDDTPLDDVIKQTLNQTWLNLIHNQPDFFDDMTSTSDWSILHTAKRFEVDPYRPPEWTIGTLNPLWQHPFLI